MLQTYQCGKEATPIRKIIQPNYSYFINIPGCNGVWNETKLIIFVHKFITHFVRKLGY